ncbi:hypothetical protein CCP3SC1AL1_990008 [Gammaproteobacteria bacterium]
MAYSRIEDNILYKSINSDRNLRALRPVILKVIYEKYEISISSTDVNFIKDLRDITKDISVQLIPKYMNTRISIPYIINQINQMIIEDIINIISIKIDRQFKRNEIHDTVPLPPRPLDSSFDGNGNGKMDLYRSRYNGNGSGNDNSDGEFNMMETPIDMLPPPPVQHPMQQLVQHPVQQPTLEQQILHDLQATNHQYSLEQLDQQEQQQSLQKEHKEHIIDQHAIKEVQQPQQLNKLDSESNIDSIPYLDLEEDGQQEVLHIKPELSIKPHLIHVAKDVAFVSDDLYYNETLSEYYTEGLEYKQIESIILKDVIIPNSDYYITEYNNSFKINEQLIRIEPNDYTIETFRDALDDIIKKTITNQLYVVKICSSSYKLSIKSGDLESINSSSTRTNKAKKSPKVFVLDFAVKNSCYKILGFLNNTYKDKLEYTSDFKIQLKQSRVMKLCINFYNSKYIDKVNVEPLFSIEKQLKMTVPKQEDYTETYDCNTHVDKAMPPDVNLAVITFRYLIDNTPVNFRNYTFVLNTIISKQTLTI